MVVDFSEGVCSSRVVAAFIEKGSDKRDVVPPDLSAVPVLTDIAECKLVSFTDVVELWRQLTLLGYGLRKIQSISLLHPSGCRVFLSLVRRLWFET